ncbi:MAG: restriction endonuclease [Candidatus Campbellbacteria bacterium]|nr:restriction endonuclease [Candidatus Campbellbacteria bacterium]
MSNEHSKKVPPFADFFNPIIKALKELGGSALRNEIENKVIEIMGITEKQVSYTYNNNDKSIVLDRIGWALFYLKKGKILKSGGRSIWELVKKDQKEIDDVKEFIKQINKESREKKKYLEEESIEITPQTIEEENFDEILLKKLKELTPLAFEKFCKKLLERTGVTNVEETSYSNDRGIDGTGVLKIQGLVSLRIAYQSKRYNEVTVASKTIRDFRGSLPSNVDKGIVITTGKFTSAARKEAISSEKSKIIDLIDGEELVNMMKEFKMGVETEDIKSIINIDDEYFKQFEEGKK